MGVSLFIWAITIAVIAGFFVFDFYSHVRTPHSPSMKEAGLWSAFYIGIALIFGVIVWFGWDSQHGIEYFTGYVTEKALSIDNLFVFALIISAFQVPREYQQKVLLIGIVLALIFRLAFILAGSALIKAWSDIFYLFALFLLYTAIKLVIDELRDKPETHPDDMMVIKIIRKVMPVSKDYHGDKLFSHVNGDGSEPQSTEKGTKAGKKAGKKRALTPLFVALLAIGFVDVMFALDSIPAIYGITAEAYLVFTANAFSLMGLRQLYFLLDGLLDRLVYLPYGLGVILGFIGVKLMLHALHENNLPFINGGENVGVPEVSTIWSLVFIVVTLSVTVAASILQNLRDANRGAVDTRIR